ncbi:MAG TPA: DEAD/DEAH box helicase [candidate division Zixibacteria bacterium]|nr:DEAD/DEAH box helicase [candidate division Zixibacteria bacterium]
MVISESEIKQIPQQLTEILKKEGIKKLTDIQRKAIKQIFTDKNLVIISPSGTGKTLIAEIIAFLDIIEEGELFDSYELEKQKNLTKWELKKLKKNRPINAKTVFLVPLRALAEEKANHLAKIFREYQIAIHMSMSDIDFKEDEIRKSHILISTYERFRTIIGRMPNLISNIKNIIIDEFHLIGDIHRGATLETIITSLKGKVRLILLSATAENPEDIAEWLNAELIASEKRLIPLDYKIITSFRPDVQVKKIIKDNLILNSQILIFCGTRLKAEEAAFAYSNYIAQLMKKDEEFDQDKILSFLESVSLNKESLGNAQIYDLVGKGTAFHHAGLSRIAKKIVEELFRRGLIKVLFCTETLGAGINLPAREVVILDTKRWNNEWLSRNVFHQIAGRAGRPNYDIYGRSVIFASDRREERNIHNRYWHTNTVTSLNDLAKLKPKYDHIKSQIFTRDEFERMLLSLIYSRKPKYDEIITLLQNSYHNFVKFNIKTTENKSNKNEEIYNGKIIEYEFFNLLLEPISNFTLDHLAILEYKISNKDITLIDEYFEGQAQKFELMEKDEKFIGILENDKLTCSCGEKVLLCPHKIKILITLPRKQVKNIINTNFAFLQKLLHNGFISENSRGRFQTTTKGSICAEMGVTIKKFTFLRDWLMYKLSPKKPTLIQILYDLLQLIPELEDDDIFSNDFFKLPIYEHVLLGKDFVDVINRHQLYEGDLLRVEADIKSLISGIAPLSDYLGLKNIYQSLQDLDKILSEVFRLSF